MLRLFYAIEFLIALIAAYTVWSQVGGQGHLDIMAWYWKLGLGTAIAFATVKATAAAVKGVRAWNARTLRWISIILALAMICGAVTFYYHMTEPPPDDQQDDTPPSETAFFK
ncbi:MAG TPA: hypothetical protein VKR61_19045 [Bryobacteraceae bacterium]|nr:hypothetical protein [Bryobacteraceae bacterium]